MAKEKILISACFLFGGYKYNGMDNFNPRIKSLEAKYELVFFCPEVMGGLKTPREPAEIKGDRVINRLGLDVTDNYLNGAQKALALCLKYDIKKALLKAFSPSCGHDLIYDGTFSHTKIKGDGVTVKLLKKHNITVFDEAEIDKL